mmetsp:Transcript_54673/g.127886  ORF Transcript_54673/g.127886 Transcript_54673/m.127886 type:complete len:218 (+) Transcript_54673:553-1206(+)
MRPLSALNSALSSASASTPPRACICKLLTSAFKLSKASPTWTVSRASPVRCPLPRDRDSICSPWSLEMSARSATTFLSSDRSVVPAPPLLLSTRSLNAIKSALNISSTATNPRDFSCKVRTSSMSASTASRATSLFWILSHVLESDSICSPCSLDMSARSETTFLSSDRSAAPEPVPILTMSTRSLRALNSARVTVSASTRPRGCCCTTLCKLLTSA